MKGRKNLRKGRRGELVIVFFFIIKFKGFELRCDDVTIRFFFFINGDSGI